MKLNDASKLRTWRKHRRLSQRELAYLCKCSQNTINLLEVGKLATVSEDLAMTIAKRLDIPWEDIFEAREGAGMRRVATGPRNKKQEAA